MQNLQQEASADVLEHVKRNQPKVSYSGVRLAKLEQVIDLENEEGTMAQIARHLGLSNKVSLCLEFTEVREPSGARGIQIVGSIEPTSSLIAAP